MTSPSQKALNALADYSSDAVAPNSMDIRTEYLEPITSNPLKYTFRLDQAGYLDTNSLIVFKVSSVVLNEQFFKWATISLMIFKTSTNTQL